MEIVLNGAIGKYLNMKSESKTCIAVIKTKRGKVIMAGDRRISLMDGSYFTAVKPKIKNKGHGILIGGGGDGNLCKLLVEELDLDNPDGLDTDVYMRFKFLPKVVKLLKSQPGFTNAHKELVLSPQEECQLLVIVNKRAFAVDIFNDNKDMLIPRITIDDRPFPWAIGCGSNSAMPILKQALELEGQNTKEHLTTALEVAAKISSGCDNQVDYIND